MPPQAGVFAIPYKASRNSEHQVSISDVSAPYVLPRSPLPSTFFSVLTLQSIADDSKLLKDRKRREVVGKLGKDLNDYRRDDMMSRYTEDSSKHQQMSMQIAVAPHLVPEYTLALYPISLERAALLNQISLDEEYAIECVRAAWEEERAKVEEEWNKGRDRIRDRMLEGIEERRKRAREDKDGEGNIGDASLDSQSRPHVTRKLRNKLSASAGGGRSPSPSLPYSTLPTQGNPSAIINPYSLALDTLPSPFPLALPLKEPPPRRGGKASAPAQQNQTGGGGGGRGNMDSNLLPIVGTGASVGLGKSLSGLTSARDIDIEADLIELRRGARRKRQAASGPARI
ncbi:hypothetical protein Clacol_005687 [Clathrus columnatus]|uniref:Uncharacterized protein n=1 Tax=Clathrus columnatus TaxID=1419009 RepID=A0AAV5AFI5_9AGAM|nr:hypothetical protein Clacol_005687 [Clathrus columnatus]